MYISNLTLKNYRKFENYSIDFDRHMNVLIGKNGSGKSSILDALTVALGSFFISINGIPTINIKPTDAHNKYFGLGEDTTVQSQYPVEISAVGYLDDAEIFWKRSLNSINGKTRYGEATDINSVSEKYQKRIMDGDATLMLPMLAYYGTARLWDAHKEKTKDRVNSRINGYLDCLDGSAEIKLMLQWFKTNYIKSLQKGKDSESYSAVKKAMEECFSRLTGTNQVDVIVNPETWDIEIEYILADKTGERIPLSQLSDGYRCALSLIGDIAYRMALLNPQLMGSVIKETPGVVLIDEVDLHLHPEWQEHILDDLMAIFPKIQFIVTTHAPGIINSSRGASLIVINNEKPDYLETSAYGKDVNTIVREYMGAKIRPVEVQEQFDQFYALLDEKKIDESALILKKLKDFIRDEDPELTTCIVKQKLAEFDAEDD